MNNNEIKDLQKELIESGVFRKDGNLKPQWITNIGPTFDFKNTPGETIQEKLYVIFKNNGEQDQCKICGKPCKFINYFHGYQSTCSKECDKILKKQALEIAVENSKKPEVRQKMIETNRKRYGVDWPMQNKEVKARSEEASLKKYGTKNPASSKEVRDKIKKTNIEKYGVENPFASEEIQEKIKQTNLEKYGVENPSYSSEIREKISEKNKINFAPNAPIWDQIKKTNMERYGVENYLQSKESREKIKETCFEKYGVENYAQTEECQEKMKKTNLERYGVENYAQTKEFKIQYKNTSLERYGVPYPQQDPEIKKRILSYKGKTKPEEKFENFLKENNYDYTYEVDLNHKNFDFVIRKDNKIDIAVEIDGEFVHGLVNDVDYIYSRGDKDYKRFKQVGDNIKFLNCDSERVNELIETFDHVYNESYEDWLNETISSMSQDFPCYNYDEKRLRKDYKNLCNYEEIKTRAKIGRSSILNFHRSLFDEKREGLISVKEAWGNKDYIKEEVLNRNIYYSNLSSHSVLDCFQNCKDKVYYPHILSPSLAKIIIDTYLPKEEIIYNPSNNCSSLLLGSCALNKRYLCKCKNTQLTEETQNLIDFHSLDAKIENEFPEIIPNLITEVENEEEIIYNITTQKSYIYIFVTNYHVPSYEDFLVQTFDLDDEDGNGERVEVYAMMRPEFKNI